VWGRDSAQGARIVPTLLVIFTTHTTALLLLYYCLYCATGCAVPTAVGCFSAFFCCFTTAIVLLDEQVPNAVLWLLRFEPLAERYLRFRVYRVYL